ncbi:MAG: hypothetical protein QOG54_110 [Actinomycetota bacterium]|jgi:hypothetical protein|nr:hypothetical protein [Actinomycetota bacterium]
MRRITIAALSLMTLVLASGLANAGVRVEQRAWASFSKPSRNGGTTKILVTANRYDNIDAGFALSRWSCPDESEDCKRLPGGIAGDLQGDDIFEIDTTLESAHLKVTRKGITHEITWTGNGAGSIVNNDFDCNNQVPMGTETGIARAGAAEGSVFGTRVQVDSTDPAIVSLRSSAWSC